MDKTEMEKSRIDDFPLNFSGGMQQRLQISKILSSNPKLVYMDEPTGGLDVSVQAKLLDTITIIVRDLNVSMIIVSHDLAVVKFLTDKLLVMKSGKVVESGLTDRVLDDPQHSYTQLLTSSILQA
jgi:putative phosphonate transport system ATP-binding protein